MTISILPGAIAWLRHRFSRTDGLMADVYEKQWSYMVIEGEDIANVVF